MRRIEGKYFENLECTVREKEIQRVGDIQKYLQRERERERKYILVYIAKERKISAKMWLLFNIICYQHDIYKIENTRPTSPKWPCHYFHSGRIRSNRILRNCNQQKSEL